MSERRPWEHPDAWGKLGPNYGRGTNDEFWDAAHVLAHGERETTFCGHSVDEVAQAYSLDAGFVPDIGSGCWTCLDGAHRSAFEGDRNAAA